MSVGHSRLLLDPLINRSRLGSGLGRHGVRDIGGGGMARGADKLYLKFSPSCFSQRWLWLVDSRIQWAKVWAIFENVCPGNFTWHGQVQRASLAEVGQTTLSGAWCSWRPEHGKQLQKCLEVRPGTTSLLCLCLESLSSAIHSFGVYLAPAVCQVSGATKINKNFIF